MTAVARDTRDGAGLPWGAIRLGLVVVGGLLVLQSSDRVDPPKLVYLVVAVTAFAIAVYRIVASRREIPPAYLRLLLASSALFAVLALSFAVAASNGTPTIDWFRDALAYGLFAAVPVLAYDAASPRGRRFLTVLLVVVGVVATASYALVWLDRRGLADLPVDRLLLPAGHVAIALYVFGVAAAMTRGQGAYRWALLAGAIIGVLLATGTRSSLLLFVAPVAIAIVMRPWKPWRTLRILGLHLLVALLVFAGLNVVLEPAVIGPAVTGSGQPRTPDAGDRFESLDDLATSPGTDPSVRERAAQYQAAWTLFLSSPVVGVGPGHEIVWTDVSGARRNEFTADTPLVLTAKFGLIGTVLVAAVTVASIAVVRRLVGRSGRPTESLALFGFATAALVSLPLGMPIEEKGFSFALAMLLAVALSAAGPRDVRQGVT